VLLLGALLTFSRKSAIVRRSFKKGNGEEKAEKERFRVLRWFGVLVVPPTIG
jgi:hypothetical protein